MNQIMPRRADRVTDRLTTPPRFMDELIAKAAEDSSVACAERSRHRRSIFLAERAWAPPMPKEVTIWISWVGLAKRSINSARQLVDIVHHRVLPSEAVMLLTVGMRRQMPVYC